MAQGMKDLKLPTPPELMRQLATIKAAGIPFQTIDGGWNPAYNITCERAAKLGGGEHLVIASPHHFPQLVSDEFNQKLDALMKAADMARQARTAANP